MVPRNSTAVSQNVSCSGVARPLKARKSCTRTEKTWPREDHVDVFPYRQTHRSAENLCPKSGKPASKIVREGALSSNPFRTAGLLIKGLYQVDRCYVALLCCSS